MRIAPPDASIGVDSIGIAEGGLEVSQNGVGPVLAGDRQLIRSNAPVDSKRRIVPRQPTLGSWIVVARSLVEHLAIGLESHIAVRETRGNPDLSPIVGRKLQGDV